MRSQLNCWLLGICSPLNCLVSFDSPPPPARGSPVPPPEVGCPGGPLGAVRGVLSPGPLISALWTLYASWMNHHAARQEQEGLTGRRPPFHRFYPLSLILYTFIKEWVIAYYGQNRTTGLRQNGQNRPEQDGTGRIIHQFTHCIPDLWPLSVQGGSHAPVRRQCAA